MSQLNAGFRRVVVCLVAASALLGFASHVRGQPARPADDPLFFSLPVALSPSCGFVGGCARFDAISLKAGTIGVVRGRGDPRFAALSGWVFASVAFLDLAEIGGAFGGHATRDEDGVFHGATMPAFLHAKLRVYPLPWQKILDRGGLQLGISYQRSFVSEKLGAAEPPGFGLNTMSLLASRSFGPVDVDLGVAALVGGENDNLRRAVMVHGTAALRLFGLARPIAPDEQLRVVMQAVYRFPLPGDSSPSDAYVLAGVEFQTHSGYRFGVAAGPHLLGSRAGGMGMFTFSVAWGPRYRNPLGEYWASKPAWIPKIWMDLWHIDPILGPDGCIRTDPSPRGQWIIKCVGKPDPNDPKTIVLDDGRRFPVGTRTWIRNDGVLITQRQEEIAQLDAQATKEALFFQRLAYEAAQKCEVSESVLEQANRAGLFALAVAMESAPGLALGEWLRRVDKCGLAAASDGGILPPLGRGAATRNLGRQPGFGHGGTAEHTQPVQPVTAPLGDRSRSHIYYGDVNKGKSHGWHYEPSADPKKGTYVIEGTRSAPDKHGVYEANVMIEGVKKNARSTFFPETWNAKQVEEAILEAYANRQPEPMGPKHRFTGSTAQGMKIQMEVSPSGQITTAYPLKEENLP
jgi:hypothetical protein